MLDVSHRSYKERHAIAIKILNEDVKEIRKEISNCNDERKRLSCGGYNGRVAVVGDDPNGPLRRRPTILEDPTVTTEDMIAVIGRFDEEGNKQYVNLFIEKQTDTFYRMVEILILRCLRQHHLN